MLPKIDGLRLGADRVLDAWVRARWGVVVGAAAAAADGGVVDEVLLRRTLGRGGVTDKLGGLAGSVVLRVARCRRAD